MTSRTITDPELLFFFFFFSCRTIYYKKNFQLGSPRVELVVKNKWVIPFNYNLDRKLFVASSIQGAVVCSQFSYVLEGFLHLAASAQSGNSPSL